MKYLAVALLLCALVSLSTGSCYHKAIKPGLKFCQDDVDKDWHLVGSKWRNSKCEDCTCSGCCTGYTTPTSFPADCVSVFDQVACKYIVHKMDDPSVLCPIYSEVGK